MLAVIITKSPADDPPAGTFYEIDSNEPVVLGRGSGADIRVRHSSVSREHLMFIPQDGQWIIKEMRSANGALLNGIEFKGTQMLKTGMTVTAGLFEFKVACNYLTDTAGYRLMGSPKPGVLAIQRGDEVLATISIPRLLDHIRDLDIFNDEVAYAALFRAVCEQDETMKTAIIKQWPDVYEILYPDIYDDEEEWEYEDEDEAQIDAEPVTVVPGAPEADTEVRKRKVKPRSERRPKARDGKSRKPKARLRGKIQILAEPGSGPLNIQLDISAKSVFIAGGVLMVLIVIYTMFSFIWERSDVPVTVNTPIVQEPADALARFSLTVEQMIANSPWDGQKQCTEALRVLKVQFKDKLLTPQEKKKIESLEKMIKNWPKNR